MKRRAPISTGPQTWAAAREDYLRGDTGPAVCKRYGIRLDALRARIWREGWSKQNQAAAKEIERFGPPLEAPSPAPKWGDKGGLIPHLEPESAPEPDLFSGDPVRAVKRATQAAAQALSQGRALEAQALIKAADGLRGLSVAVGPLAPPESASAKALRAELGLPRETEDYDAFLGEVWEVSGRLAMEMLAAAPDAPRLHAHIVFAWRARHLGPKVAAEDLKRAREQGWADKVFDPAGRPLPPPPPSELRSWIEAEVAAMGVEGKPLHPELDHPKPSHGRT